MEIQIRKFKESDATPLVQILYLNNQYNHPMVEGPAAMRKVGDCEAAVFLVAETEKQPRGLIRAVYDGSRALIYLLSIHPDYQRKGIGSILVEAVCEELVRRGAPTVNATVTEESFPFWEKKGFKQLPIFIALKEI